MVRTWDGMVGNNCEAASAFTGEDDRSRFKLFVITNFAIRHGRTGSVLRSRPELVFSSLDKNESRRAAYCSTVVLCEHSADLFRSNLI